jgi:hypothetical protein
MGHSNRSESRRNKNRKKTPRPDGYAGRDEAEQKANLGPSCCGYTDDREMENSDPYGQVGEIILMADSFI